MSMGTYILRLNKADVILICESLKTGTQFSLPDIIVKDSVYSFRINARVIGKNRYIYYWITNDERRDLLKKLNVFKSSE